ncbi:hypothetical protein P872_14830 [Rhodonellum psychrophilum GCM71 = DSM 17998]|uniref:Uncharacterized protein n=1 Tax=Rhodonellum psychrophilum GCM71 = DSM 17998 TaxID=1123057 RepID=U5C2N7_9BACT|nr:hypothetical protein P872_14830 [Rhodonellum psychrophilum GCM71 = DSM 17998]
MIWNRKKDFGKKIDFSILPTRCQTKFILPFRSQSNLP